MDQLDELLAITKAVRDSALLELNKHAALEAVQNRKMDELNKQVQHEIEQRSDAPTGLDTTVDAAWSAWVRRERGNILREIARIRALRSESERHAKIALAKYSASDELRDGARQERNARLQKKRDESLEQLSIMQTMAQGRADD